MEPAEISPFHLHVLPLQKSGYGVSLNYLSHSTVYCVYCSFKKKCARVPQEQHQETKSIFNGNYLNEV